MFRVFLLLLAVAGLHSRPLQRFPNGKLKQIGPQMVQDEHRDNSVLKHMNTDVNSRKHLAAPAEFCRQGTEPSRRFLMDLNTGTRKYGADQMKTRLSGLDEFRQDSEKQMHTLQELRKRPVMKPQYSAESEKHQQRAIPAEVYRKHTGASRNVLMNTGLLKDSSEHKENHREAPAEIRRQGTEPSRRILIDENTGMPKEQLSEMNRRVSGFYNPAPVEKRQGTEPSRRILIDIDTGMLKHELSEMNRRVSGFYNPPAYEMKKGTQNSHATLVDPRTGQLLPSLTELQRSTAPVDEFRQGTEYQPYILQELRWSEFHKQGTEPSRDLLMNLNAGLLKEHRNEMDRRVGSSAKWVVVSEHEDIRSKDSSEHKENHREAPAEIRRQGTEPSRRILIDENTGMPKEQLSEMNRRVSGLDEFRQGTEYQPYILQELRWSVFHKQGTEPSRDLLMDLNNVLLKEHQDKIDSSEHKENHREAPAEIRRQGTEPSRRILIDENTGMPKEQLSEMNRRVSGFYNPAPVEKRQGTEPSRRILIDIDTGMLKHELSEMNRRVSGFYNPPAYEMKKGTQNSHATLVDPRTGQLLPSLTELQRSTAPVDEFRQGTEYQLHTLQELRVHSIVKPQ